MLRRRFDREGAPHPWVTLQRVLMTKIFMNGSPWGYARQQNCVEEAPRAQVPQCGEMQLFWE